MDDEEFGCFRVAEFFLRGLLGEGVGGKTKADKDQKVFHEVVWFS